MMAKSEREKEEVRQNGKTLEIILDLAEKCVHDSDLIEVEHRERRSTLVHADDGISAMTFENATERTKNPRIQVTFDNKGVGVSRVIAHAEKYGFRVRDIWQTDKNQEDDKVQFAFTKE